MGRKTTSEGKLILAFAEQYGISRRTAQRHREKGSPEWRAFVTARGRVPDGDRPLTALEKAATEERDAWEFLHSMAARAKTANIATQAALASALRHAQERYIRAQNQYETMKERAGRVVAVEVIRDIQSAMIAPLGRMYADLRDALAAQLPPAQRAAFYAAWQREYPARERMLHELDEKLEDLIGA